MGKRSKAQAEFDFYHTDIVVANVSGLVNSLEGVGGVCVSVSRDPGLKMVFASKASSLLSKASKYHNESFRLQGKELQKRMGRILLGRILVLAPNKSELKVVEKLVEAFCNPPLKWERRRVRKLSELMEFKLSDGRVVCIQRDLAGVLRVFAERGYRVEAFNSRIVVYDERGEEIFSSSF